MKCRTRAVLLLTTLTLLVACKSKATSDEKAGSETKETRAGGKPDDSVVVTLDDAALKRVTIRIENVARRRVVGALRLPAEVRTDPDRIAHITPLVASQVEEAKVRPGDRVKKGQTLALLKSVELGEARAQIAQAKASLDVARDQFARQEQLMDAGIGAQRSYVEAQGAVKQANAALAAAGARAQVYGGGAGVGSTTLLKSPLEGTVVERHATAGEIATPDRELFTIANIDRVWVIGRAYESDLALVHVGAAASVRVQAYPGRSWDGSVSYVSPTLSEQTRTAEVRVELENSDGALKPGMFATVLPADQLGDAGAAGITLAVPAGAAQRDGDRSIAFVARDKNHFERRIVTLGKRGADYVEIVDGLREGEPVVVEGAFILKSEAAKHLMGEGEE